MDLVDGRRDLLVCTSCLAICLLTLNLSIFEVIEGQAAQMLSIDTANVCTEVAVQMHLLQLYNQKPASKCF